MKLIDLNPKFLDAGGVGITLEDGSPAPHRRGVGLSLDCPCGCGTQLFVPFANPLDGGPAIHHPKSQWQRTGETFQDLTLRPSVLRVGCCGWHGFITNGEATSV